MSSGCLRQKKPGSPGQIFPAGTPDVPGFGSTIIHRVSFSGGGVVPEGGDFKNPGGEATGVNGKNLSENPNWNNSDEKAGIERSTPLIIKARDFLILIVGTSTRS